MSSQTSRSSDDRRWKQLCSRPDACEVGFAVGSEGTQIAKDTASIILLDVNLTCIVVGAKQRRNVFNGMQRLVPP